MNYLAKNIKYLRNKKKWSQEELAGKLEVKRSSIAAYESKNVNPKLEFIVGFSKLFNISISDLIEKNLEKKLPEDEGTGHVEDYGVEPSHVKEEAEKGTPLEEANALLDINDPASVKAFIQRSLRLRKMLEGFKAFYQFKVESMRQSGQDSRQLGADMENFILLMEHLMEHNEALIKGVSRHQGLDLA